MCLLVPGRISSVKGRVVVVDYGSEKREGRLLEEGYAEGDYVLLQGGVVVQKVDPKEAREALDLYNQALTGS